MLGPMTPINTPDELFHDGNFATGAIGTLVTAAWLNEVQASVRDVQSELIQVLAESGITPDADASDQLLLALKKLAWGNTATRLASQAEAEVGTDNVKQMSPLRVKQAILKLAGGSVGETGVPLDVGTKLTKTGLVLDVGAVGSFDANMVESPSIWFDPNKLKYGMVYTGYDANSRGTIGVAWSDDLVTWSKERQLLAQSGQAGAPDVAGATGPHIRYENGTYYLFYIGLTAIGYEAGQKTLCLATSPDLQTWTRHGTIIGLGSAGSASAWRAGAVWHPNVVKRNGVYYLFFNASGADSVERIGYATSPDLLTWTVDDVNSPLISPSASGWDSGFVGDPSLYKINDTWVMAYYGYANNAASDGIAYTTDAQFPLGWTKYSGNPVLSPTPGGVDSQFAHKPFIYYKGGVQYHYYTATDGTHRRIALAMSAGGSGNVVQVQSGYQLLPGNVAIPANTKTAVLSVPITLPAGSWRLEINQILAMTMGAGSSGWEYASFVEIVELNKATAYGAAHGSIQGSFTMTGAGVILENVPGGSYTLNLQAFGTLAATAVPQRLNNVTTGIRWRAEKVG